MTGGAIGAASCGGVAGRFPTGCGCTFSTGGLFTLAAAREGSLVAWPRASTLSTGRLGVLRAVFGVGRSTARTCWSGFFKEVFGILLCSAASRGSTLWGCKSIFSLLGLGALGIVFAVRGSAARTCWSGFFREVFGIFSCCSARRGSTLRGCKSIFASLGLGALGILVTGGGVAP